MLINALPLVSTLLLVISFLPLLVRVFQTRSSFGISKRMMLLGVLQCACFVSYDWHHHRTTQAIAFLVFGLLFVLTLGVSFRFSSQP